MSATAEKPTPAEIAAAKEAEARFQKQSEEIKRWHAVVRGLGLGDNPAFPTGAHRKQ